MIKQNAILLQQAYSMFVQFVLSDVFLTCQGNKWVVLVVLSWSCFGLFIMCRRVAICSGALCMCLLLFIDIIMWKSYVMVC